MYDGTAQAEEHELGPGRGLQHGDDCPECGGELHANEDRYEYGDGRWLVCEEIACDYEVKL